jgi:hypothetical protein
VLNGVPPFTGEKGAGQGYCLEIRTPSRPTNSTSLGFADGVSGPLENCRSSDDASQPSIGLITTVWEEAGNWVMDVPTFIPAGEAGTGGIK